jgi:hypothetical protein
MVLTLKLPIGPVHIGFSPVGRFILEQRKRHSVLSRKSAQLMRHLTPALSPNSVGGEGETSAASLQNLRLDLPDSLPQN